LASIATVVGLFLAVSWLGVWLMLPPLARAIGLGLFFLLAAAAFAPLLMVRMPSSTDGLRRLDRNSSLPHRPATTISDDLAVDTTGGLEEPKAKDPQPAAAKGAEERKFVINEAGTVTLRSVVASDLKWQFTAIPDRAPTISLAKDPEAAVRGALQLAYKVEDD